MNIANLLVRSGTIYDTEPAVALAEDITLTYQKLAQRSATIANKLLLKYQLKSGDRVAVISSNCPEYIELLFAIWHAGLIAVPVNSKLHINEFSHILENSGAKLCFANKKLTSSLLGLLDDIPSFRYLIAIDSDEYNYLYQGTLAKLVECLPDDPAWLFYTSGTTGKSKGALLSHKNLFAMTFAYFSDIDAISAGDSIFHAAPMSHGSGFYILPTVANGGINVIPASGAFKEQELLNLLAHYRNVSLFAAPTMVKRWLAFAQHNKKAFGNLKTLIYGGGPMYQQDLASAHQLLGNRLVQMYGQGECPMTICALSKFQHNNNHHPHYKRRLASVGTPMLGIEIEIVGEDGCTVKIGQTGEIVVRGDAVMLGYFNNPEATKNTIIDGWLKTGDMAIQHDDGFITLVDRSKDIIISGGSNIYPREVEEILNQHPDVIETSVFGKNDDDWGEIVIAAIVAKHDSQLCSKTLDDFCLENMTRFKRPKNYIFVEQLPKNNTGKILKTQLRQLYG